MRQGQREELQLFKITWQTSARKAARRGRTPEQEPPSTSCRHCHHIPATVPAAMFCNCHSQPAGGSSGSSGSNNQWQIGNRPMGAPGVPSSPVQRSLPALCPAVMNKNRINLRQSRFGFLRSFVRSLVRFLLLVLKGSPNSSAQLELEPSPGSSVLCLPVPLPPLPAGCATFVSVYRVH